MQDFVHQTKEGLLRAITANLRRAYGAEPLTVPEVFIEQIRSLKDQPASGAPKGERRA